MILRLIIIVMSLLHAGYLVFDGIRALIIGDYIRPQQGQYAGQLGPWSALAEKIGIDPMSALMKLIFVITGLYGLVAVAAFASGKEKGWTLILIFSIISLWNLMFGTMSSIIVLLLLFLYKMKG